MSRYTEYYTCPKCGTYFRAVITTGVQPCKTDEPVYCPVCWDQVDHKNITGDVDCYVESLDKTIEPYKTEYLREEKDKKIESKINQIMAVHPEGILSSVIKNTVSSQIAGAAFEDVQTVLEKMHEKGIITINRQADGDSRCVAGRR